METKEPKINIRVEMDEITLEEHNKVEFIKSDPYDFRGFN